MASVSADLERPICEAAIILTVTPAIGSGLAHWIEADEGLQMRTHSVVDGPDQLLVAVRDCEKAPVIVICGDLDPGPVLDRLAFQVPMGCVLVLLKDCGPMAEARLVRRGATAVLPADIGAGTFTCALRLLRQRRAVLSEGALELLRQPENAQGLTERQRQVLDLLEQGLRPGEIAERLTISPNTVKTHIKRLRSRISAGEPASPAGARPTESAAAVLVADGAAR